MKNINSGKHTLRQFTYLCIRCLTVTADTVEKPITAPGFVSRHCDSCGTDTMHAYYFDRAARVAEEKERRLA